MYTVHTRGPHTLFQSPRAHAHVACVHVPCTHQLPVATAHTFRISLPSTVYYSITRTTTKLSSKHTGTPGGAGGGGETPENRTVRGSRAGRPTPSHPTHAHPTGEGPRSSRDTHQSTTRLRLCTARPSLPSGGGGGGGERLCLA